MMSGRTPMTMSSLSALAPLIRDKRMRALAATSASRSPMMPEVPTMIEAGIPGFIVTQWHGTIMPAGTPRPIVERMYREIARAVQRPDIVRRLGADGTIPIGSAPAEFAAHMKKEDLTWRRVIQQAGVRGGG
jgi:tripartite-type tricarboxylate transporter receptor subunit TctC